MAVHFLEPVHEYIETIKVALGLAGESVTLEKESADIIWVPYKNNYLVSECNKSIIYVWHGGSNFDNSLRDINFIKPAGIINLVVKYDHEFKFIKNLPQVNCLKFLGKHTDKFTIASLDKTIKYAHFQHDFANSADSYRSYNTISEEFKKDIKIFGTNSPNGYAKDTETLPHVKYLIFLKSGGYICNSIKKSIIFGIPIIMLTSLYEREYSKIYPRELFILCNTFDEGLRLSEGLSDSKYAVLSNYIKAFGALKIRDYEEAEISDLKKFITRVINNQNTSGSTYFDSEVISDRYDPTSTDAIKDLVMSEVHLSLAGNDLVKVAQKMSIANQILDDDWLKTSYSHTLARLGIFDKASEILRNSPNYMTIQFLNMDAQNKLLEKTPSESIKVLEDSLKINPNPWAFFFKIEATLQLGDKAAALSCLEDVELHFPDFNMLPYLKSICN
ncbi:hypothetical protein G6724_00065 [Polynucleobacter paneuropaeus]|nr:hypothetical protein [Polynucleobacter paneuropaeus]